jgi:hypothetical protein
MGTAAKSHMQSWSAVACHRFGRAEQVPPPSHLFSQATAIGEYESGGKPPHSKIALRCAKTVWSGSISDTGWKPVPRSPSCRCGAVALWRSRFRAMYNNPGTEVGQAFQPDKTDKSGWKA